MFPRTMTEHGHKLADDAVATYDAGVPTQEPALGTSMRWP